MESDMAYNIDILLAVYNGEKYLEELLQSILNQSYTDWRLIIRNDGSRDGSRNIIQRYCDLYPGKVVGYHANEPGGPLANFSQCLEYSDAPYIMFADQDDVWLPNKIEMTLNKMKAMEKLHGSDCPLYVYTDLTVVDRELKVLHQSMWKSSRLTPENGTRTGCLLVYNVTTGCTAMLNRPLKELSWPLPSEAVMHDNWIALVASIFGKSDFIEAQTILYRQHGNNVVGATAFNTKFLIEKIRRYLFLDSIDFSREKQQARVFLQRYREQMNREQLTQLEEFINLDKYGFFKRRHLFFTHGFNKPGMLRNVGMLFRM